MMSDGRSTIGEEWRSKAQDMFEDMNSSLELIYPGVSTTEKREMWSLYLSELKRQAREGTDDEKKSIERMFNYQHTGKEEDESVFDDIDDYEYKTNSTHDVYNMSDQELENRIKDKVPKHLFYDLYNLYYTPNVDMKIKAAPENLRWAERMLFNSNNPYTKAITENVPAYAYTAVTEIIKYFLDKGKSLDDQGVGGMQGIAIQNMVNEALKNAQDKMQELDDVCETTGAGKVDGELTFDQLASISEYYHVLKDVPLRDDLLKDFIKKTLKLSRSYFSSRYSEVEQNILDVDQLEDLEGMENLISPLDIFNIEELVTHERIYHQKLNTYVDRSGSMGGYSYWNGKHNTFLDSNGQLGVLGVAKLTALKLHAMGEVHEVRAFDNSVHKKPMSVRDLLFLKPGGGTTIDRVIQDIREKGTPSIIITDLQDSISLYSPDVYFIGVGNARFSSFMNNKIGKAYLKNHQCVKYTRDHDFVKVTVKNVRKV